MKRLVVSVLSQCIGPGPHPLAAGQIRQRLLPR